MTDSLRLFKEFPLSLNKTSIPTLFLKQLSNGYPALTPAAGERLAEAASVALEQYKHESPVALRARGAFAVQFALEFFKVSEQMRRTYGDPDENTEEGACGIALLLLINLTKHTVVRRSRKGTGVDYFLGDANDFLFQNTARLEVSGIGEGTEQEIKRRIREKKEQTQKSDYLTIPVYVVIVEFSAPVAEVIFRDATRGNGAN